MTNRQSSPICFECKSALILVSQEIVQPEGSRFAQTNLVYRCSNEECQKEKDKEKLGRISQQQKREIAEQRRAELIVEKRKLSQKLKT